MNGSSSVLPEPDVTTERTPLLSNRAATQNVARVQELPFVEPTVERIRTSGSLAAHSRDWVIESLQDHALKSAFRLVVLLSLKANPINRRSTHLLEQWEDVQESALHAANIHKGVLDAWNDFLAHCSSDEDFEVILWTGFPLNDQKHLTVSVADFLILPDSPHEILTHPIIVMSLHKAWCKGLRVHRVQQSKVNIAFTRLRELCPARVMHLLDLFLNFVYLTVLANYAIMPPTLPVEEDIMAPQSPVPGLREIFLIVYSFAQMCKLEVYTVTPFILTFLAFFSSLPSIPMATDVAYSAVLIALSLHVIQLHFPLSPSPFHFLPCSYAMPLSTLIWHGVSQIFLPVLLFFFPALLLSLFLLSASLSDATNLAPYHIASQLAASPLEARTAFLTLFVVFFVLMVCSLVLLVLAYPTFSSSPPTSAWDRYSATIGADARRYTIRLLQIYSTPTMFPAPLNIIQYAFVQIPTSFYGLVRIKRPYFLEILERALWIIFVSPLALLIGIFWVWGYVT